MGACITMFVVANCLGGVIEAGVQVEMCFHTKHTSYLSNHSLNN